MHPYKNGTGAVRKGFVVLTVVFRRENGWWIARCEELGTGAQAETLEDVQEQLADLLTLDLNTMERRGVRQAFFDKFGIRFFTDDTVPHHVRLDLPVMRGPGPVKQIGPLPMAVPV